MVDYRQAYEKMERAENIIILPHDSADGDALGCAYAMKLILIGMGKRARVLDGEPVEHRLIASVSDADGGDFDEADLVICVDSADLRRLGERGKMLEGVDSICFDHHKSCTEYADVNCVVPDAGACAEVIYDFCVENKIKITAGIANNLYMALSSDTGGFRQSNASAKSMEIGAELIRAGAESARINTALFLSNSISHVRLVGEALQSLEFDEESGIASITVTLEQMERVGAVPADTDGIVQFARDIIGVKVAIFLRERVSGGIKGSLRSNDDRYDVSEIAAKFGGGGHLRAAGCEMDMGIGEAKDILVRATREYMKMKDRE